MKDFEWDENKNQSNQEKHGISFERAKNIFDDEKRITIQDTRNDYGEDRWITVGKVIDTIMVVVYTIRNTAIRIISARIAKRRERNQYNKQ